MARRSVVGSASMPTIFRPVPDLHERVWGGHRLGSPHGQPIGEAWVAGPSNVIADGPDEGRTLAEVAAREGAAFVGRNAGARTGDRFPLLVKLLDPAAWLSVQVHPDDATARQLEGPEALGKAEAWYVLDAAPVPRRRRGPYSRRNDPRGGAGRLPLRSPATFRPDLPMRRLGPARDARAAAAHIAVPGLDPAFEPAAPATRAEGRPRTARCVRALRPGAAHRWAGPSCRPPPPRGICSRPDRDRRAGSPPAGRLRRRVGPLGVDRAGRAGDGGGLGSRLLVHHRRTGSRPRAAGAGALRQLSAPPRSVPRPGAATPVVDAIWRGRVRSAPGSHATQTGSTEELPPHGRPVLSSAARPVPRPPPRPEPAPQRRWVLPLPSGGAIHRHLAQRAVSW